MNKTRGLGLTLGVALILALLGVSAWQNGTTLTLAETAYAQGPTPTPPAPQKKGPNLGQAFWDAFAKRLGVTVDDLTKKAKEAAKDVIDQAVKDGKLTQAQADRLKQGINQGRGLGAWPPRLSPFGRVPPAQAPLPGVPRAWGGMLGILSDELEAVAKLFKMAPADLTAALRTKNLAEIAKEKGVDEKVVKQTLIDTAKARIDRLVQDGLITKEQGEKAKGQLSPDKIDLTKIPRKWNLPRR